MDEIARRFGYVFTPPDPAARAYYKPALEPHGIAGPFRAAGIEIVPFAQDHGFSETLGFRIGGFAYSTDVINLDDAAFAALAGVELWIVDCIRRRDPEGIYCPAEAGYGHSVACIMSTDAYWSGRRMVFDPEAQEIRPG